MFVEVILPIPLSQLFTYKVPIDMQDSIQEGIRVVVQFGRKKYLSGVVRKVLTTFEADYEIKEILSLLDEAPLVNEFQFKFWEWIADYYQCTVGEVYKAAIPAGLKLESETKIYLADQNSEEELEDGFLVPKVALTDREQTIITHLNKHKSATIDELMEVVDVKNVLSLIKSLLDKGLIVLNEEMNEGFKPKEEKFISLTPEFTTDSALTQILTKLTKAPKQADFLMGFLHLIGGGVNLAKKFEINRKELLEKVKGSSVILNELIKKGVFQQITKEGTRLEDRPASENGSKVLNDAQAQALKEIETLFETKDTVLLHGVTSSGKTEIYFHLIEKMIAQGKQALYLLPEIALTTQITTRLAKVFGNNVGIYHSKFSDAERVEIYRKVLQNNSFQIILGVRSSIFLPFSNLGLIIVDEEHEQSFKQFDPAPRYNARDSAYVLAKMHNAKLLLGTATPSVESYYNAKQSKIGMVQLLTRHRDIQMPQILTVDIKDLKRKKLMNSTFSPQLLTSIKTALDKKEQVILFQNRRGFSPFVECSLCGFVPKCQNCDVSMTYHRSGNQLVCHYCGISYVMYSTCKACKNPNLQTVGFGTQKIEEEIKIFFPEASVARMDTDTTKTRKSFEKLINDFEQKRIDILIGTQMISKGLDFNDVSLVGVLNADSMLNIPDFRAHERGFQMMSQVAGRAGRKNKQGLVILQSSDVEHPVIVDVLTNNFENHFALQLQERQMFKYPPFVKLISLTFKHKDEETTHQATVFYAQMVREIFGGRVLGPQVPPIPRIQNLYIRKILFKFDLTDSLPKAKRIIKEATQHLHQQPNFKSVQVIVDVDPM